jgi:hypothetical protein
VPALAKNQNGSVQQQTTKREMSRQEVPAPIWDPVQAKNCFKLITQFMR